VVRQSPRQEGAAVTQTVTLTLCLQRGGITGQDVPSALVDPHLDDAGREKR
jgi:hypothetical protein